MSLDGCTEDERGAFDWAPRDDDVFVFITAIMRAAGTYLYGRRMYASMGGACTRPWLCGRPTPPWPTSRTSDYASAWQAADKVVYSLDDGCTTHREHSA